MDGNYKQDLKVKTSAGLIELGTWIVSTAHATAIHGHVLGRIKVLILCEVQLPFGFHVHLLCWLVGPSDLISKKGGKLTFLLLSGNLFNHLFLMSSNVSFLEGFKEKIFRYASYLISLWMFLSPFSNVVLLQLKILHIIHRI